MNNILELIADVENGYKLSKLLYYHAVIMIFV